jgi:hypothetical protein
VCYYIRYSEFYLEASSFINYEIKRDGGNVEDYCQYQQRMMAALAPSRELYLLDVPGFSFLFSNTYLGILLRSKALNHQKRPLEALTVLIQALNTQQFWINHSAKWWKLMIQAVLISRDLFPSVEKQFSEPLLQLMSVSQNAPQPWQGREVAYCFATFSLWSYQKGRIQKAIDKIRVAIHADPQWGYAEYLLGWYGLLLEGIDPVPHFVRAIQIEGGLWQCFKQDPLVARFPEMVDIVEGLLHRAHNSVK